MIELPEALTLARELNEAVAGKTVAAVYPPTKLHKFCWFNGDPALYSDALTGKKVLSAEGFGIFVEISFENKLKLCFNDGVNIRLCEAGTASEKYQLLILFTDNSALVFTVAMYGGIILHDGSYDNEYYLKSRCGISPFSEDFGDYFDKLFSESKPTLSAKAFLATEQRFPGIGNGVLQDILFAARIHPKRKIGSLTKNEAEILKDCTVGVLSSMTELGGRDTEKDIYGNVGSYKTMLSKNTCSYSCPVCEGAITKQAYLGGSVYFCPVCQKL